MKHKENNVNSLIKMRLGWIRFDYTEKSFLLSMKERVSESASEGKVEEFFYLSIKN